MIPRIIAASTPPMKITLVISETTESGIGASIEPEEDLLAANKAAPTEIITITKPVTNKITFVKITLTKIPLKPNSPNHNQSAKTPLPNEMRKIDAIKMASNIIHFKRPARPPGNDKLLRSIGGNGPLVIIFYLSTYPCSDIFTG